MPKSKRTNITHPERYEVNFTAEEAKMLARLSERSGLNRSQWIRQHVRSSFRLVFGNKKA